MDPQATTQTTETVTTTPTPRQNSSLVAVLSVLSLLLLGATGVLAYQNYQLNRQVTNLENRPLPAATPTVLQTPSPSPNLKVYTNTRYSYQLEYPQDWTLEEANGQRENQEFNYLVINSPKKRFLLAFGIRKVGEQTILCSRTGVGAGDFVKEGTVNIGTYQVPATYLIFQGKAKDVFYPGACELFKTPDKHELYAEFGGYTLPPTELDNLDLKKVPEFTVAKQILSSFKFTN